MARTSLHADASDFHRWRGHAGALDAERPRRGSVVRAVDQSEAKLLIVLLDDSVPTRRDESANERSGTLGLRMTQDLVQHHLLDAAPQHSAAHQPRIDVPFATADAPADDHADHAVVTKAVDQAHLE